MAEIKKSDNLPQELSAEILLLGAHTLEQGEREIIQRLLKRGLENFIAQKAVHNRVAWQFKQLNKKIKENKEEEKEMNLKELVKKYDAAYEACKEHGQEGRGVLRFVWSIIDAIITAVPEHRQTHIAAIEACDKLIELSLRLLEEYPYGLPDISEVRYEKY